jgi:hypothetical protein
VAAPVVVASERTAISGRPQCMIRRKVEYLAPRSNILGILMLSVSENNVDLASVVLYFSVYNYPGYPALI